MKYKVHKVFSKPLALRWLQLLSMSIIMKSFHPVFLPWMPDQYLLQFAGHIYNRLKFSVFKTQLVVSTFPSIFSFFLPLMFYVLVKPPTTSHYSSRLKRDLGVISDPFLDPTSTYLVTSFCLFYLINLFWISPLFLNPWCHGLNSRPHYVPLGLLQ